MGGDISINSFSERDAVCGAVLGDAGLLARLDRIGALLEKLAALLGNLAGRGEAYISARPKPHIAGSAVAGETKNPPLRATVGNPQIEAAAIGIEPLLFEVFDPDRRQAICRLCHLRCGFSPCLSPCSKARL